MHAGSRIVRLRCDAANTWSMTVLARFEEHQSMNYGSDCVVDATTGQVMVLSTSFYDKRLCLWRVDLGSEGAGT